MQNSGQGRLVFAKSPCRVALTSWVRVISKLRSPTVKVLVAFSAVIFTDCGYKRMRQNGGEETCLRDKHPHFLPPQFSATILIKKTQYWGGDLIILSTFSADLLWKSKVHCQNPVSKTRRQALSLPPRPAKGGAYGLFFVALRCCR